MERKAILNSSLANLSQTSQKLTAQTASRQATHAIMQHALAQRNPRPPSRRLRHDEAIEVEGQPVEPGMKGKVISLHDGFHLDVARVAPIPPKAIVQFDSGMRLMVDERMKWEKAD